MDILDLHIKDYFKVTPSERNLIIDILERDLIEIYIDYRDENLFFQTKQFLLHDLNEKKMFGERKELYEMCEIYTKLINRFDKMEFNGM